MRTQGWSGLYWVRKNEAGDYEIRVLTKEGEGYPYPGGVFSKEAFERLYEKADDIQGSLRCLCCPLSLRSP